MPLVSSIAPKNIRKPDVFLMILGGIEGDQWHFFSNLSHLNFLKVYYKKKYAVDTWLVSAMAIF